MDRIKQINSIFKIARSQLSKQAKTDSLTANKKTKNSVKKKIKKTSPTELKKSISEKLRILDKKSPDYNQQSRNIFLESVLLWEFGEDIINAPEFHQMLDKISNTICNNKESSRKFSKLIKQLRQL